MKKADLAIIRRLTVIRLLNAGLLKLSFWYTRIFGVVTHLGKPISLSIEPTTACNLGCP